jgi:hypothetical protein
MAGSMESFFDNGWVGVVITLLTFLAGTVIVIVTYLATRSVFRLAYQRSGLRLIGSPTAALPSDVAVLFRGDAVEQLTKTSIIFWNSGNRTIPGSDIVKDDPIRFEFTDKSRVLDVSVSKSTRSVNQIRALQVADHLNWVLIDFDFLDGGDGAAIEVLHTDAKLYPKVAGTVRGIPKGILDWGQPYIFKRLQRELPFPFKYLRIGRSFFLYLFTTGVIVMIGSTIIPISILISYLLTPYLADRMTGSPASAALSAARADLPCNRPVAMMLAAAA